MRMTQQQCHQRDLLTAQIRTITDEIVALELEPATPHHLQQVRERREKLLAEYDEHVASHGCTHGTHQATA